MLQISAQKKSLENQGILTARLRKMHSASQGKKNLGMWASILVLPSLTLCELLSELDTE